MQTEIHTFKEWDYPFIAQNYENAVNADCSGMLLAGIVVEKGDDLNDIIQVVEKYIKDDVPAVMVELEHVWDTFLAKDVVVYLRDILRTNGYTDTQSYEHRLSYCRFPIKFVF